MSGMVGMVLKGLGVNVTAEQIAQLEAIIPQIIPKMQETLVYVNANVADFHAQLEVLKLHRENEILANVTEHSEVMAELAEQRAMLSTMRTLLLETVERIDQNGRRTGSASDNHEPAATTNGKRKR